MKTIPNTEQAPRPRIVCELNASARADEVLAEAIERCRCEDAELLVVWVLEPRVFNSPFPGSGGAAGAWGLPHVLHAAIERAREVGVNATSAVRIGHREVVLRSEANAHDAIAVYEIAA
jgi:hypothetical protein